ncbi:MAG: hypothetical protein IPK72_06460 [Candidatus Eisenbacteria bacterium]|nr:hypothetical protein [Candidatus Eisenbacteria bacterium]
MNDTKSETATANATVMPNSLKNWPTIPPMKPTGMKTAKVEQVVARTARPISLVPRRAAARWSSPMATLRTMFSRTTMASSIRIPVARERAIRVMVFRVNPKAKSAINAAMIETGSVRPVMTVERQELRKVKTTRTVRIAPITIVTSTSSTDSRIQTELSRTIERVVPGGSCAWSSWTLSFTRSATSTVFAPETLRRSKPIAGTPLTRAAERASSASSRTVPRSLIRIGTPARSATTRRLKSAGEVIRPATRKSVSFGPYSSRPAGSSRFSVRSVAITCSTGTA